MDHSNFAPHVGHSLASTAMTAPQAPQSAVSLAGSAFRRGRRRGFASFFGSSDSFDSGLESSST